jgi:hypothetical protein
MPVVPPIPTFLPSSVFWNVGDVLNFARMLVNDMQGSVQGQELADNNPYTIWLLNLAYSNLQSELEDTNVEAVTKAQAVVGPLVPSPLAGVDPSAQVQLGFDGYWNADPNNPTDGSVALPGDLLQPLQIEERPAGSNQPFVPMNQVHGILPSRWSLGSAFVRFGVWQFRKSDTAVAIYMPAASMANELRINYVPSLDLFTRNEDGSWPQIPLARAGEALAYGVAAMWTGIRGAANAAWLAAQYKEKVTILSNKSAKRDNTGFQRPQGYGFGRNPRRGWYW